MGEGSQPELSSSLQKSRRNRVPHSPVSRVGLGFRVAFDQAPHLPDSCPSPEKNGEPVIRLPVFDLVLCALRTSNAAPIAPCGLIPKLGSLVADCSPSQRLRSLLQPHRRRRSERTDSHG